MLAPPVVASESLPLEGGGPVQFGESRGDPLPSNRKHGRQTPSTESVLSPKRLHVGQAGATPAGSPPPYSSGLGTPAVQTPRGGGWAGPSPPDIFQAMFTHFGEHLNTFGQALTEMGEHQKKVEETLGGQIASLREETLRNTTDLACKMGRALGDSMTQIQQNMSQLAATIPPHGSLVLPKGGGGGAADAKVVENVVHHAVEILEKKLTENAQNFEERVGQAFETVAKNQADFMAHLQQELGLEFAHLEKIRSEDAIKINDGMSELVAPILDRIAALETQQNDFRGLRQEMVQLQNELGGALRVLADRVAELSQGGGASGAPLAPLPPP